MILVGVGSEIHSPAVSGRGIAGGCIVNVKMNFKKEKKAK